MCSNAGSTQCPERETGTYAAPSPVSASQAAKRRGLNPGIRRR
jgi:hypothetical protein